MSIEAKFKLQQGDFKLDVELCIPEHGFTALYGASGAGKTTLLRAIAGLEKINGGYLKFADQVWHDNQRFTPTHQRGLAYVFQEASLFDHLDVNANIQYGAKRTMRKEGSVSIAQAIELLGVEPLLSRKPNTLSGGERQRVAIARALASSPKLLLMDEPLAALDQPRKQELMPYLESLHRSLQIPIIYVSHAMDEVARLADHLLLLEAGKVLDSGPISEMFTRLDLPLARDESAESIMTGTVAAHDEKHHLSYLNFAGGRFTITQKCLKIGEQVRIRIAARDVSITLQRQTETSILNCFAATIQGLRPVDEAQMVLRLSIDGVPVLARITRKSVAQLDLYIGKQVFAQIKSAAILG